jgi:hypothetical protein
MRDIYDNMKAAATSVFFGPGTARCFPVMANHYMVDRVLASSRPSASLGGEVKLKIKSGLRRRNRSTVIFWL